MSRARNERRKNGRDANKHITTLAILCGDFYEFLSGPVKPSDEQVRAMFIQINEKWEKYCRQYNLMNMNHMFKLNIAEAWKRHTAKQPAQ